MKQDAVDLRATVEKMRFRLAAPVESPTRAYAKRRSTVEKPRFRYFDIEQQHQYTPK